MGNDRIQPFSCGSQAGDWMETNCDRCTKGWTDDGTTLKITCPIQDALITAWVGDGTITPEMAKRMGYERQSPPRYGWPCSELNLATI